MNLSLKNVSFLASVASASPKSATSSSFIRSPLTQSVLNEGVASNRLCARKFQTNLRLMPTGAKLMTGNMIEFRADGDLLLGVVRGQNREKWMVHDAQGNKKFVRGQDVSLVLPGDNYTKHDVNLFLENASGSDNSGLVEISWHIMEPTNQPVSLTAMAEALLGSSTPMDLYRAYRLLRLDRQFFKMISTDPPLYFRLTAEEVQTQIQNQEKREDQEQELEKFKTAVSDALELPFAERPLASDWLEGAFKDKILALKEFGLGAGPDVATRNLALASLRVCDLSSSPNAAILLLESIRVITKHQPIALIRAGIESAFPANVQEAAKMLTSTAPPDPDKQIRRDLTGLHAISIDDEGTREIDDALSIETLPSGDIKVWMHVSDPTRWIELDTSIDLEARNRATSLYIPTGPIPAYPWELAEGCFSLTSGHQRCALSLGAILSAEGALLSYDITPSIVCPTTRFTYENVETCLKDGTQPDLTKLLQIAQLRNSWRKSNGAIDITLPECRIKVTFKDDEEEPEIVAGPRQIDLQSRQMVSEFMILAGEIAGRAGAENGLALPYRSQANPALPTIQELKKFPEGVCRQAFLRTRMTRGLTSTVKIRKHCGLGIDHYVQITSPIRRYSDFLAHLQLKSHLRGDSQAPLGSSELDNLITTTTNIARARNLAAVEVFNYWVAEYFRCQPEGTVWTATLLGWNRQSQGVARIIIDDLGLERGIKLQKAYRLGSKLKIAVAVVNVKSGTIRFEEVINKGGRLAMDA